MVALRFRLDVLREFTVTPARISSVGVLYSSDDESIVAALDFKPDLGPGRQCREHGRILDPKDHGHGFHVVMPDRLVLDHDLASIDIDPDDAAGGQYVSCEQRAVPRQRRHRNGAGCRCDDRHENAPAGHVLSCGAAKAAPDIAMANAAATAVFRVGEKKRM